MASVSPDLEDGTPRARGGKDLFRAPSREDEGASLRESCPHIPLHLCFDHPQPNRHEGSQPKLLRHGGTRKLWGNACLREPVQNQQPGPPRPAGPPPATDLA